MHPGITVTRISTAAARAGFVRGGPDQGRAEDLLSQVHADARFSTLPLGTRLLRRPDATAPYLDAERPKTRALDYGVAVTKCTTIVALTPDDDDYYYY
jgi:hypothetical protein